MIYFFLKFILYSILYLQVALRRLSDNGRTLVCMWDFFTTEAKVLLGLVAYHSSLLPLTEWILHCFVFLNTIQITRTYILIDRNKTMPPFFFIYLIIFFFLAASPLPPHGCPLLRFASLINSPEWKSIKKQKHLNSVSTVVCLYIKEIFKRWKKLCRSYEFSLKSKETFFFFFKLHLDCFLWLLLWMAKRKSRHKIKKKN